MCAENNLQRQQEAEGPKLPAGCSAAAFHTLVGGKRENRHVIVESWEESVARQLKNGALCAFLWWASTTVVTVILNRSNISGDEKFIRVKNGQINGVSPPHRRRSPHVCCHLFPNCRITFGLS